MTRKILVLLGILLVPIQVNALQDTYICRVKQIIQLSDAGNLGESISAYQTLVGQSFMVDRKSGKLDGAVTWLRTSELERVTIISDGKQENNFKSISIAQPPTSVSTYLHVQEVNRANIKPFYIATGNLIFGGTCE